MSASALFFVMLFSVAVIKKTHPYVSSCIVSPGTTHLNITDVFLFSAIKYILYVCLMNGNLLKTPSPKSHLTKISKAIYTEAILSTFYSVLYLPTQSAKTE